MVHEKVNWDPVPPLAPLSGGHHTATIRQANIVTTMPARIDEDSNMSGASSTFGTNPATPSGDDSDQAFAGFEGMLIPGSKMEEDSKDGILKPSQVVTSNKMLADLLDKKSSDPPFTIDTKRKRGASGDDPAVKRAATDASATSSAANAYAKLAASLLEDEDMEEEPDQPVPEPKPVITMPMQRQIIVSPNNPPQMILAPTQGNTSVSQHQHQQTATIKTESGYQTVPLILQHGNSNQMANIQIQKHIGGMGQQIMQPVIQQQQTQYVLATNQQGQTILVAQQPPPPVNQILVTQTTQQQGGQPTKTIIILQQQPGGGGQQQTFQSSSGHQIIGHAPGQPQKVYVTNQQGQQMIVTQVPRPVQHQVIVNQHPISSASMIQSVSTISNTINQVATGSLPVINSQQQMVSHVQLQQSQLSLPASAMNQGQMQHQTIQIQKQPTHQIITQSGQQVTIQQHPQQQPMIQQQTMVQQTGPMQQTMQIQQNPQIQHATVQQHVIQHHATGQQVVASPQPQIQQTIVQQRKTTAQQKAAVLKANKAAVFERKTESPIDKKVFVTASGNIEVTEVPQAINTKAPSKPPTVAPTVIVTPKTEEDLNHMWVCDWRGCQG